MSKGIQTRLRMEVENVMKGDVRRFKCLITRNKQVEMRKWMKHGWRYWRFAEESPQMSLNQSYKISLMFKLV